MTVVFLSDKHDKVVSAIRQASDSIELVGGADLVEFLSETRERNEFFSRLVILDTALTKGAERDDFLFLKDYVESYSPSIELVLAIPRNRGSELADLFLAEFSAPMYTVAYLPESSTVLILTSLVSDPVLEVKAKYFSLDASSVKSKESRTQTKQKKEKKKGFFSSLFGGNKQTKQEAEKETKDEIPTNENSFQPQDSPQVAEVPVAPTIPAADLASTVVTEAAPQSEELQKSISTLFGSIPTGTSEDEDDSLNFGNFGNTHFQTGYIGEEEEESISEPASTVVQPVGWSVVGETDPSSSVEVPTTVDEDSTVSNFVEFSPVPDSEVSNPQNFGSGFSKNFAEVVLKFPANLDTLGVTLVTGSLSSKFISEVLSTEIGYTVIDTKDTVGMLSYIDERSYLESEEDFYVEGGNSYVLSVPLIDVDSILNRKSSKVLVNVSAEDLDRLLPLLSKDVTVLTIFSSDVSSFENQLLEFERLSPASSRKVNSGYAVAYSGLSNKLEDILENGVFSRINWKGCFE